MRLARLAFVLLIAAAAGRSSARAEEPTLPTPPRQAEPWAPPRTSLPQFLVSAPTALFEQGLADPRGCEYRTIQIAVGGVWGGQAHDVATNGWVLPAAEGGKSRHAIAWSGLVYPLIGVGGPADLDADAPAWGTSIPIRMCDFYAWQLATLEGAPTCNPRWPESRRDAGLAAIMDFLRRKGPR